MIHWYCTYSTYCTVYTVYSALADLTSPRMVQLTSSFANFAIRWIKFGSLRQERLLKNLNLVVNKFTFWFSGLTTKIAADKMSLDRIVIYCDDGTSNVDVLEASVRQALNELQLHDRFIIDNVTAHDLIYDHSSLSSAKLFIMPGGRDLPYVKKLAGKGNDRIREFVKQGGRYLGLCAGAYFASNVIEFEKDTTMEVCGLRELKFYHGLAKGCVYPGFKYNDNSGARIVPIRLHEGLSSLLGIDQCRTYYNGGCQFIALQDNLDVGEEEILASYASDCDYKG